MDTIFLNLKEVSARLRIKPKTLKNYESLYPVYRSDRFGIWHIEHVKIIEKVHVGVLEPEEGLAFWELAKNRMKTSIRRRFGYGKHAV